MAKLYDLNNCSIKVLLLIFCCYFFLKKLTKYLQLLIQCDIIFKYVKIQNLIEWENEKFQDVQMTTSRKIYRRFYRG